MAPPRKRAPGAGRPPRSIEGPAVESVRVSLTESELADVDAKRGAMTRADYVRACVFAGPVIPPVGTPAKVDPNAEAVALSRPIVEQYLRAVRGSTVADLEAAMTAGPVRDGVVALALALGIPAGER